MGEQSYLLKGYKNQNAFKGKRNSATPALGTGRKQSLSGREIPSISITCTIKVHCMDMLIGQRTSHVIILMNGIYPYYFKTVDQ